MLVRKAAHEVAGVELELCLRTVIVCVDDDGPKLHHLQIISMKAILLLSLPLLAFRHSFLSPCYFCTVTCVSFK